MWSMHRTLKTRRATGQQNKRGSFIKLQQSQRRQRPAWQQHWSVKSHNKKMCYNVLMCFICSALRSSLSCRTSRETASPGETLLFWPADKKHHQIPDKAGSGQPSRLHKVWLAANLCKVKPPACNAGCYHSTRQDSSGALHLVLNTLARHEDFRAVNRNWAQITRNSCKHITSARSTMGPELQRWCVGSSSRKSIKRLSVTMTTNRLQNKKQVKGYRKMKLWTWTIETRSAKDTAGQNLTHTSFSPGFIYSIKLLPPGVQNQTQGLCPPAEGSRIRSRPAGGISTWSLIRFCSEEAAGLTTLNSPTADVVGGREPVTDWWIVQSTAKYF